MLIPFHNATAVHHQSRSAPAEEVILYQTGSIRVRRTVYPPGRHLPLHSHKGRVVVFLSDGTVRTTTVGGQPNDLKFHRGMVYWSDPVTHTLDNVGGTPLDALEVEFLGPYPAKVQPYPSDADKQDPAHFKLEFENDRVRVLRLTLAAGQSTLTHNHADYFFVSLEPPHLVVTMRGGGKQNQASLADEMGFRRSLRHLVENLSDQNYEEITIEFKASPSAATGPH